MLEGLEISEVNYSYIQKASDIFRFDSFFFCKEFIQDENIIIDKQYKTLKDIGATLRSFGAYSLNNDVEYQTEGIPFVRGINLKNGLIDFNNSIYITPQAHQLLWKSEVKPETLLLSMSGTIGDVAIALPSFKYPINSNQDIAKIDLKGKGNPYYIYAFLRSKFGQNYLKREARGSVQQHVFLSQMELFKIPLLNIDFQKEIECIVKKGFDCVEESKSLYAQAEQLLLEELGLKDWQPSTENINEKTFKESFLSTGRLDAEYYQPKYEDYINLLLNYKKGYTTIEWACQLKDISYAPKDNHQYKYIELANIGKTGEINGCSTDFGINLPSRARRQVKMGDVLISSIEGSLSSCALVTEEYNDAICSTGFYVIKSKEINSETLLVLFKSEVLQNLLKQGCSGTILTAINKDEFLNIPIPIIENLIQDNISSLIQKSFMFRKQSEHLLEVAKRAVEIAIEQNEDAAIEYINENTYNYG